MKNIQLLPTDKPSRLGYLTKKGKEVFNDLRLFEKPMTNILDSENQNIYITSDEEITGFENNIWVIKGDRIFLWQNTMALVSNNKPKKIILTTDQDLIKDGVQAIDDEFLEWYVQNPSCEEVEINEDVIVTQTEPLIQHQGSKPDVVPHKIHYKIIIPKEEPKQETLEEAAERISKEHYVDQSDYWAIGVDSFKRGAKWQSERMYSKEEVEQIITQLMSTSPKKWFEQLKK